MSRRLKPAVAETGTAFRSAMPAIGRSPEQLVGIGFRCWLAGYETGEIACWEQAWTAYADVLGNADAKRALGDLSCWVRSEEHTSELQSQFHLVCRLLLEKKK